MGIVGRRTGSIRLTGARRSGCRRTDRQLGIGYCRRNAASSPAYRRGKPDAAADGQAGRHDGRAIYELFPNLKERRTSQGTRLSGGEQQMLAIGRILRTGADFILLDEPTEGLAPVIIQQIGRTVARAEAARA